MPDFIKCLRDIKENTTDLFALVQGLADLLRKEEQVVSRSSIITKARLLTRDEIIFFKK